MKNNSALEISAKELYLKLQKNIFPLLLDVRGEKKFNDWHIFNSQNLPVMKILETKSEDLKEFQNREIITICGLGNDSLKAAKDLREKGFNALSLKGGLKEWNSIHDFVDVPTNKDIRLTQVRRIAKGCLSYIVSLNNEAFVIDPSFHIDPYVKFLDENDLTLTKVFDTHLHADHISGAKKLAEESDAKLYLSLKDPYDADKFNLTPIKHNENYKLNGKFIKAIHTPGHTKGSISFKIGDLAILTGDTAFVDGVGRPDLANRAEEFASDLYNTLVKKITSFTKEMMIAPAHHGKFLISHFNNPIISSIADFSKLKIIESRKDEFIEYILNRVKALPHPPSYNEIREINAGLIQMSSEKILDIEIGPNRCAIN